MINQEKPKNPTITFKYHVLEVIKSDNALSSAFAGEIIKDNPNLRKLEEIIAEAEKRDATNAKRKIAHTIENQVQSSQEVLREVAVQNTVDAYADLIGFLAKRDEPVNYPLKIKLKAVQRVPQQTDGTQQQINASNQQHGAYQRYDISIRDYAIGMNLYDVLYKLLSIGDTQKKEKQYYLGGHGRGFKPSISFCDKVIIDSFGRRTIVRKIRNNETCAAQTNTTSTNLTSTNPTQTNSIQTNPTQTNVIQTNSIPINTTSTPLNNTTSANNGNGTIYLIEIGEESDVRDGTRITLENITLTETPLNAVKKFAQNLSSEFDFRVNNVRVNRGLKQSKLGKIWFKQTHDVNGRNIEEKLVGCSKDIEGEEVQHGPMTMYTTPSKVGFVKRILKIPTGYLFSRSRNQLPKEIEDIVNDSKQKTYRKFYDYLMDNIHKIGSHEFRFMDSFSTQFFNWDKLLGKVYKHTRNSIIIFSVLAGISFMGVEVIGPALNKVIPSGLEYIYDNILLPTDKFINEDIAKYISNKLYRSGKETGSLTSEASADSESDNTEYDTNEINLPKEFVPEVNKKLFVTRVHCKGTKCNKRTEQEAKADERFIIGRYSPSDKDVFFKFLSYNVLNNDGSWRNGGVKTCVNLLANAVPNKKKDTISVALNLNVAAKTILPAPIGYFTGNTTYYSKEKSLVYKPENATVGFNSCLTEPSDYDTIYVQAFADRTGKVEFGVTHFYLLDSRLEKIMGETWKKRRESTIWSEIKHFFDVPFKIKYPKAVEKELRKVDKDINKWRIKTYDELAQRVTKILRDYFIYNTSPENARRFYGVDNFVNGALDLQGVDCDTANAPLCAVLRARYDIPTRLDIGIEGKSGVLDKRNFHNVCEAYIPNRGWTEYDATPTKISKETVIEYESSQSDNRHAKEDREQQRRQKTTITLIANNPEAEKMGRKQEIEKGDDDEERKYDYTMGRKQEAKTGDDDKRKKYDDTVRKDNYEKRSNFNGNETEISKEDRKDDNETKASEEDRINYNTILKPVAYSVLAVCSLGLAALGIGWYRSRIKEKRLWDEPIVDVYVKEDNKSDNATDGNGSITETKPNITETKSNMTDIKPIRKDKISLNQGIEYLIDEMLHYDKRVVEHGIDELKQKQGLEEGQKAVDNAVNSVGEGGVHKETEQPPQKEYTKEYPDGFYVLDYGFYTVILDALLRKNKLLVPYENLKKEEAKEESESQESDSQKLDEDTKANEPAGTMPSTLEQEAGKIETQDKTKTQDKLEEQEGKKPAVKIPNLKIPAFNIEGEGDIGGILSDISISKRALKGKRAGSQSNVVDDVQYSQQIEAVQDIVDRICSANNYSSLNVNGDYEFNNNRKILALREAWMPFRKLNPFAKTYTICVNISNQRVQRDVLQLRADAAFIDSLIYTIMLANEVSLNRFNELKKAYLNKVYLHKTDLHI
ncbi:transglutaminase domain-containing protein [Candidatus Woesearchaeota archaeon]|nr:transglutaminase domain-containing protein [Candidatus Woesearchaeota archaeon]